MATGSATYYRLLSETLADRGVEVAVVSERRNDGPVVSGTRAEPRVAELFPRRTARNKGRFTAPLLYAAQNLTYLGLPSALRRLGPKVVLVHSSFFNWPNVMRLPLRLSRRSTDARFVLDVRDRLLPRRHIVEWSGFDAVIACSQNVLAHLRSIGAERPISLIPIPQEPLHVGDEQIRDFRDRHRLARPYVLYAGLVKELKRIDLLLEAFNEHVRPAVPGIDLVVAGMLKTSNPIVLDGLRAPGVKYLGPLPREEVLTAMAGAELVVNLSPNEGLPRSSLEALALGARVALPPNVPEFAESCPDAVVGDRDPGVVAERLRALMLSPPARYPVQEHDPARVVNYYLTLLFGASASQRA